MGPGGRAGASTKQGARIDSARRVFLFLQGPISPFFERLALALVERGHEVRRINLCFGDRLLWRKLPAANYRGTSADWPGFIRSFMEREAITDLVLLGDRRPLHIAAADIARERGIRVFATELGYLRPDWITLERNGLSTYSHFPCDPDAIRGVAKLVPPATLEPKYTNNFIKLALMDMAYNLANVVMWPWHPHYRWHAIYHPLAEYAGWAWRLARRPFLSMQAKSRISRLEASGDSYYCFPLQLETDYQIRANSPFKDGQNEPIAIVLASFAKHAPPESRLLFKVHPLDNGLVNWRRRIARMARSHGIGNRVIVVDGGDLSGLLRGARGVITVNSTVGTAALAAGRPLMALGSAIFVVEGLTFFGPLDDFWVRSQPPDRELFQAFVRALAGTIQIKGGFITEAGMAAAAREAAKRLDELSVNEPGAYVESPPRLTKR